MGRAPCCDKANVKRGPWSPEEDAKLKDYIDNYGTGGNWIALPQKIGLKRCGKSCRLRWLNYLRPNIKHGDFTGEEDNIILNLYISIGSRWSIIAAQLPGRTDNDIKNYWNTKLKKKLLGRRKQNSSKDEQPALSSSALERLQLHMHLQSQQLSSQNDSFSFSLLNNPTIWPKLHPIIREKLVTQNNNDLQNLNHQQIQHPFNTNSIDVLQYNNNNNNDNCNNNNQVDIEQIKMGNNSSLNGSSTLSLENNSNNGGNNEGIERVLSFQSELDKLLCCDQRGVSFNEDNEEAQQQMGNDFERMHKWWSYNVSSNNSISWDSPNVIVRSENN